MQVVVLAGPESLTLVRGRPFVDWQLDRFVASGARTIVLCVGPQEGEEVETHVRRAMDRGLMVAYSYAGEQPGGTGSALRRAFARLQDDFVLTFGDRYLPFDYSAPLADLRAHPDALGTLTVCRGAGRVALEGDWVQKYEGPDGAGFLDASVIALRRAALADIEDGAVWPIEALFRRLSRQNKLRAFVAPQAGYVASDPELERYLGGLPELA